MSQRTNLIVLIVLLLSLVGLNQIEAQEKDSTVIMLFTNGTIVSCSGEQIEFVRVSPKIAPWVRIPEDICTNGVAAGMLSGGVLIDGVYHPLNPYIDWFVPVDADEQTLAPGEVG